MSSPLNISRASFTGQRSIAASTSVSRRRVRGQDATAAHVPHPSPKAASISVPVALAQPGVHAASSNAVAAQEWAQTAQADVVSHRRSVAAYPTLTANVRILAPGLVTAARFISINVRA